MGLVPWWENEGMGKGTGSGGDPGGSARTRRRGARRVVRAGNEREVVLGVSADERADGWGDAPADGAGGEQGSNDERLLRDVPPHW